MRRPSLSARAEAARVELDDLRARLVRATSAALVGVDESDTAIPASRSSSTTARRAGRPRASASGALGRALGAAPGRGSHARALHRARERRDLGRRRRLEPQRQRAGLREQADVALGRSAPRDLAQVDDHVVGAAEHRRVPRREHVGDARARAGLAQRRERGRD